MVSSPEEAQMGFVTSRAGRPTHFLEGRGDGFSPDDALLPNAGTGLNDMVKDAFDLALDKEGSIFFSFNDESIIFVKPNLNVGIFTTHGKLTREQYEQLQSKLDKISQEIKEEEERT